MLNTSRDICRVLNDALTAFGCPAVTLEQTIKYVGDGARKLIERAVPANFDRFEELYNYYRINFAACDNALTTFYEGEDEFLREVKSRGIKTAVLSNKPDDAAQEVSKNFFAPYGFDLVMGHTKDFGLKPDPSAVFYIMKKLGVGGKECLFVGDGEADIATAANAGIDCASVLWGFRTREQLAAAGGKNFVSSYPALLKFVLG